MTLSEFDNEIRKDHNVVCGCDEAGRGPLAGDVFAAAVIFDKDTVIEGINDSKKLTAKKREELFDEIMEKAVDFSIQTATVEEIEDINILNAAMLAMKRAVEDMDTKPDVCLIDGVCCGLSLRISLLAKGSHLQVQSRTISWTWNILPVVCWSF